MNSSRHNINPHDLQDQLNQRAYLFSRRTEHLKYEKSHAQNYMRELVAVYGIDSLKLECEYPVYKSTGIGKNWIDGFLPGLLLIEMKSADVDLDKAYHQAREYVELLRDPSDKPRYILVSDFKTLRLHDETGEKPTVLCKLADFKHHVNDFDFLLGYERIYQIRQEQVNIQAAEKLGALHDSIKKSDIYFGAHLHTLLVRLLFCLFADDTELFYEENAFHNAIRDTPPTGEYLGERLNTIFAQLNTHLKLTDEQKTQLAADKNHAFKLAFPYVNGGLFKEHIPAASFDSDARKALLECCDMDWSRISPDIFGTLFQHIMHWDDETSAANGGKTKKRRDFGAHYTSERNIRRAIEPLFLNELKEELNTLIAGDLDAKKLGAYIKKLQMINIFDPACGCGNFLVVTYRELRALEHLALHAHNQLKKVAQLMPQCDVHQFYGIEIDPTSAEIATVALWLTDHQMNRRWASDYKRLPLEHKASILCANALQIDWNQVIKAEHCSYIVGNPPFLGYTQQSKSQKEDMELVFNKAKGTGVLDYVCAWYVKAWQQIQHNPEIKCALVSTNSITQGEQVSLLWEPLVAQGLHIHFAHRTFKWSNDGAGVAAVHCVIVGFGKDKPKKSTLWDYSADIKAEGKAIRARRINPYLFDAPTVFIHKRSKPICEVNEMTRGSQPTDGGNLLLSDAEKNQLLAEEPAAQAWIRPFLMGDEFINNISRWCLWFEKVEIEHLKAYPKIWERIEAVKQMRLSSTKLATQKFAQTPHLFQEIRQPLTSYLALPRVSSELRSYIPIGYLTSQCIAGDKIQTVANATLFDFANLTSTMHNAWMRAVCGRLESRYSYSNTIVYNNYPWPQNVSSEQKTEIETCAQAVLDARTVHEGKSLAWLYNPDTMPENLKDAHAALDDAVDEAYGYTGSHDDAPRVAFLFDLYAQLIESKTELTK